MLSWHRRLDRGASGKCSEKDSNFDAGHVEGEKGSLILRQGGVKGSLIWHEGLFHVESVEVGSGRTARLPREIEAGCTSPLPVAV
jgi:hypothetical protein